MCGIRFSVAGLHCVTHSLSFTVYPPGWVPYARKILLSLDHSGGEVISQCGTGGFADTLFAAAADAAAKNIWPEEVRLGPLPEEGVAPQSRRTQRRHVAAILQLFRLSALATPGEREIVARLMNVSVSSLEAGAKKIREGPSLICKGLEVVIVLEQFQAIRLKMTGLLTLGSNQGFWGLALHQ